MDQSRNPDLYPGLLLTETTKVQGVICTWHWHLVCALRVLSRNNNSAGRKNAPLKADVSDLQNPIVSFGACSDVSVMGPGPRR